MGAVNVSLEPQMLYNYLLIIKVVIMHEYVVYKGERFWIQTSGRYYQSSDKKSKYRLLHRRIWFDHYGEIPKGYVIHHIDHNWKNNDISNLQLLEKRKHASEHTKELFKNPEYARKVKDALRLNQKLCNAWHSTEEGLKWHSDHGRNSWKDRKKINIVCSTCGKQCKKHSAGYQKNRYCSSQCRQKSNVKNYFTDKRHCLLCKKEFMANRHKTTTYCSRLCSNKHRFSTHS